jgi:RNA polymerase-interacting CarD/CdnL/TRCF family regulator
MAAPYEVEAKLYMLNVAERNLRQLVPVDEIAGRGVRIIKAICG